MVHEIVVDLLEELFLVGGNSIGPKSDGAVIEKISVVAACAIPALYPRPPALVFPP